MTKKQFEVLAKHIRMMMNPTMRMNAATAVASACAERNPRFNTQKFDPAAIRCHAESFSTEAFRQKLTTFIEEKYADHVKRTA